MKAILLPTVLSLLLLDTHAQHIQSAAGPTRRPSLTQSDTRSVTSVALSGERHARLYFDSESGGATWVRGRGYKARFDGSGATLYPFLGSEAPALHPFRLALESATAGDVPIGLDAAGPARCEGARITIGHGPIDELYDVGVDAVEQSFVIRSFASDGDLRLRLRVDTDLAASERVDGIAFTNELGGVHYGHAFVRDSHGRRIAVSSVFEENHIEIVVPQDVVARVGFPLVVDPIISFFTVHQYQDQFASDIAYDATNDVYLVVEEEKFASPDDDVFVTRISGSGANLGTGYADISSADWQTPKVANLNAYDQFLVVASAADGSTASGQRFIVGRETPASSLSFGSSFPISPSSFVLGEMVNPDVGGDPYPFAPAYYCVAWQWNTAMVPQTREIAYTMVNNASATHQGVSSLTATANSYDELPSVSNGNNGSTWTVAWQRYYGQHDILVAYISWSGFITTPEFLAVATAEDETGPSAASPYDSGEAVIAYVRNSFIPKPLGVLLSGTTALQAIDLSTNVFPPDSVQSVSADCDGRELFAAFSFIWLGGPDPDVQFASFSRSGTTFSLTSTQWVDYIDIWSRSPAVCATHATGGLRRFAGCTYDRADTQTGPRTTLGFIFKKPGANLALVCGGPGFGTNSCPCGGGFNYTGCPNSFFTAGGQLAGTDGAFVSEDTFVMTATNVPDGPCLFFQGTSLITSGSTVGTPLGDGLLCLGGTIARLGIRFAVGNTVSYPGPGDPPVSVGGAVASAPTTRFYQGWYRDSATFCSSSTFNLTTALQVDWLP